MRAACLLRSRVVFLLLLGVFGGGIPSAQAQNNGFQISRYEPTAAGENSFWVDHPWYSRTRYFAAGVTLDYGHNPLLFGLYGQGGALQSTQAVIAHQLIGHVDLAGSFLDRVLLTLSLPIVLLESGAPAQDGGIAPSQSVTVGDPRLGFLVRIYGQPDRSALAISAGGSLWLPLRKFTDSLPAQASDQEFRGLPKLVLGGVWRRLMWSATVGFLIRPTAVLGTLPDSTGATVGPELQLGVAALYADPARRFAIGPELGLGTALSGNAFAQYYTALEALLGLHYNVAGQVQLGLAGGLGLLRLVGTPDARALLRVAYAPIRNQTAKTPDPADRRVKDRDGDGVPDAKDQCPDTPAGPDPDSRRPGCPNNDQDHDGIADADDLCPSEPMGPVPDPTKKGCPAKDHDGDGVHDHEDLCPDQSAGPHPDPARKGCPEADTDGDGFYDSADACKDVPAGLNPDPQRPGCPLPDRDHDSVPDDRDACPDQPGAPSADPKKNGCPNQYVTVNAGQITIKEEIFFDFAKHTIKKRSYKLLDSVAQVLKLTPAIKRVAIEGHADNKGTQERNRQITQLRAQNVMAYLITAGIAPERLQAKGYGSDRPIADNATAKGRARNRRVDFFITDPPQTAAVLAAPPPPLAR